jgi:hypothetical protein
MSPESPDEIDKIPPPTNSNAADEFENLKTLVKRHVALGAQPRGHADLVHEIDVRISDAQNAEAALRSFPLPIGQADLTTHNNALLRALESRVAYELLRKLLNGQCGALCAPIN